MSSFFDEASLVMIPSGYKDQKVYSVKPLDGSGDLTFSRASSATRVASNGLIEKVRTNLLTYSNTFSNVVWDKSNLTATGGQDDPNGGTSAFLLTSTATSGVYIGQAKVGLGCLSIYAKAGTRSTFALIPTGYNNGAFFDLSSVTATASGIGSLAKIESVGGGWFRCSVATSSSTDFIVSLSAINGTGSVIGDTMTFAFAQGETGDIATDYIPTTSAAVSVGPVSGLPRLDYLNSTCPRLLLEPQRTNQALYSEQFNNAYWVKTNATITANNAVSPDGYTNADLLTYTTSAGTIVSTAYAGSATTATSVSLFVKAGTSNLFNFGMSDGILEGWYYTFNLATQTATLTVAPAIFTSPSFKIENYGNGWYRLVVSAVSTINGQILLVAPSVAGLTANYNIYGAQIEVGAYATSYIPTLGTSVTRVADAASKTGITSLIGQTEGTLFAEFDFVSGETANYALLHQAAFSTYIFINQGVSGTIFGQIQPFGVSFSAAKPNGRYKCALAYKSGDSAFFVNGVQVGTTNTTTFTPATMDIFNFTADPHTNSNYQALLFKTRLTNAQLAELTTL
jgi:hypothetical protein